MNKPIGRLHILQNNLFFLNISSLRRNPKYINRDILHLIHYNESKYLGQHNFCV